MENPARIYNYFEKKFGLGSLALCQATCIASLFHDSTPVSMITIAPSGQEKTMVMKDILKIFPAHTIEIASRFTSFGLAAKLGGDKIDMKTMCINDMVRTFDTMPKIKIKELVSWLAELLSEGKAGSETAVEHKIEAHTCIIGNIAISKYREVSGFFKSSTFSERILQFTYKIDKNQIRAKPEKLKSMKPDFTISLKKQAIIVPQSFRKKIWNLSDTLAVLQQYEEQSLRTDTIITSWLKAHALLSNRKKISQQDIRAFENLLPYLKKII